jgi:hypothetical protein
MAFYNFPRFSLLLKNEIWQQSGYFPVADAPLEKLIVAPVVKKFLASYRTQIFIVFTKYHQRTLF